MMKLLPTFVFMASAVSSVAANNITIQQTIDFLVPRYVDRFEDLLPAAELKRLKVEGPKVIEQAAPVMLADVEYKLVEQALLQPEAYAEWVHKKEGFTVTPENNKAFETLYTLEQCLRAKLAEVF